MVEEAGEEVDLEFRKGNCKLEELRRWEGRREDKHNAEPPLSPGGFIFNDETKKCPLAAFPSPLKCPLSPLMWGEKK